MKSEQLIAYFLLFTVHFSLNPLASHPIPAMIPSMSDTAHIPTISLVIPTRNEAANIRPLLTRLTALIEATPTEIIFVDDSTDDTPDVIDGLQSEFDCDIRLIHRPAERRNGLSGAVVEGFGAARGAWLGVMDADLQHPPEMMARLFRHAQQTGADVVVGSRAADIKGPKGLSLGRTLTSQLLTILARTVFPRLLKNSSDPLTGLFLVRRSAVDLADLQPEGFKILLEILVRCPNLHVSELFFDFEARHAGESKADFREGMRFFRHLLRLRLTANVHVTRLLITAVFTLLLNFILLLLLAQSGLNPIADAIIAAEAALVVLFVSMETWVYFRRTWNGRLRRALDYFASSHLLLLIFWLPLVVLTVNRARLSLLVANLLGLLLAGGMRYLFSEQWIWTRGLISRYREPFRYSIHGIVNIESAVHIPDLSYFRTVEPFEQVDIRLLIDRHGTPTQPETAISYSEGLGRFGFALSIIPGETTTEAVVSPPVEKSPFVLYKNVIEPLLRWTLVRKGYALVYGGTVAVNGRSILITAGPDIRKAATLLHVLRRTNCDFMGDDVAILDRDGTLYSFPRLLAIRQHAVRAVDQARLTPFERVTLWLKRLLYDERVRQFGLLLHRWGFPIATLNMYLQRVFPPAKIMMHRLLPDVVYRDAAQLAQVVRLEEGSGGEEALSPQQLLDILIADGKKGFGYPPYSETVAQLSQWRGEDLTAVEQQLIASAVRHCPAVRLQSSSHDWWKMLEQLIDQESFPLQN